MSALDLMPVTVLGLGPMGRALATALLSARHPTTVWNRTSGKARGLDEVGATIAPTAADAVVASPLVLVCVRDAEAVATITHPLVHELADHTLVDLTAASPTSARNTALWAEQHDVAFLSGAIMTPVPTIGGADASILISGPRSVFADVAPVFEALAPEGTTHVGEEVGRARAYEVALLDAFWTAMTGTVHAFALGAEEGVAARDLAPHLRGVLALLPDIADEFAANVDDDRHPGHAASLASALAGIHHVIGAATERGLDTSVLQAAADIATRTVAAGHGDEGFSILTRLHRARTGSLHERQAMDRRADFASR